ncbi:hypothetical protein PLICRDRAFT_124630 [Plicaturopsis crispa FD-325 SS-3]|nr:hypothetical protein PLICRDRAFT_124630 [Plicaturopsis crispa FD-325 SS-3]
MSFLRPLRCACQAARISAQPHARWYAAKAAPAAAASAPASPKKSDPLAASAKISSCEPNTVLEGINYLKGQNPVIALPDEEYPPWLWTILDPVVIPDDGPGGKAEKYRMRKENRQRIKDSNFLKTQ